jgi:hypothetical protein
MNELLAIGNIVNDETPGLGQADGILQLRFVRMVAGPTTFNFGLGLGRIRCCYFCNLQVRTGRQCARRSVGFADGE